MPPKNRTAAPAPAPAAPAAKPPENQAPDLLDAAAPAPGAVDLPAVPAAAVGELAQMSMDPKNYVAVLYQPFNNKFDALKAEADRLIFDDAFLEGQSDEERAKYTLIDITTKDGMAMAVKMRAGFRDDVRLDAEKAYRSRKDPLVEVGRLLDSGFRTIKESATPYELRFDKAIKDEAARLERIREDARIAEEARVAAIRADIAAIVQMPERLAGASAAAIHEKMAELAAMEISAEIFFELVGEAAQAKAVAGATMHGMRTNARQREADEADRVRLAAEERRALDEQHEKNRIEAERLQKEQIERDRKNAETERHLQARLAQIEAARKAQEAQAEAQRLERERDQATASAIKVLRGLAETTGNARAITEALEQVRAAPEVDGIMGEMLATSKEMAIFGLERKLESALVDELPAAHAEALEMDAAFNECEAPVASRVEYVAPAPEPAPPAEVPRPRAFSMLRPVPEPAPAPAKPDDSAAVSEFLAAVRKLARTRDVEEIRAMLYEEFGQMDVERQDQAETLEQRS